jgi:hypothetical protein
MSDYKTEVLALGPVGYWRLGEASGTNAADELSTNDGTYTNTPTLGQVGSLALDTDTAVLFASASSEYVTMGDIALFDFEYNLPFSVSAWVKTSSSGAYQYIASKQDHLTPYLGWAVSLSSAGAVDFFLVNTPTGVDLLQVSTTATTFNDGN